MCEALGGFKSEKCKRRKQYYMDHISFEHIKYFCKLTKYEGSGIILCYSYMTLLVSFLQGFDDHFNKKGSGSVFDVLIAPRSHWSECTFVNQGGLILYCCRRYFIVLEHDPN